MTERREDEDAEDIRRVLAGDESAFADLVTRHARRVHDLARRMLRDAQEAEDMAQQAFLNAYRALPRFDPERPFRNWLLRITSNLCRNRLAARKVRRKERAAQGTNVILPTIAAPQVEPPTPDWTPGVQEALDSLPERYRLVVVLRYQHGCSLREISAITETPLPTVKTHLHRGRAALRKLLSPPETSPEAGGTGE